MFVRRRLARPAALPVFPSWHPKSPIIVENRDDQYRSRRLPYSCDRSSFRASTRPFRRENTRSRPSCWNLWIGSEPGTWTSSVLVRLHPRASHPGLSRTLTVPLAELEHAVAKDKLTGKALTDFFLEEMLADPMTRLVMQADGVAEAGPSRPLRAPVRPTGRQSKTTRPRRSEPHRGMRCRMLAGPRSGSARPGIGE